MRLSVERLRWVLVGGAVLLVAVLVGSVEYGTYLAKQKWKKLTQNIHISHDSSGVTYSQSDGKRTIFTLHAAKAIPQGDGKYTLNDAKLMLFGKVPGEDEMISGQNFDYDQKNGIVRAVGEVKLELHTSPSPKRQAEMASGGKVKVGTAADLAPNGSQTIHVTTSGLQYMKSLGVATTKEKVEFSWGGLTCDSDGAEFDPDASQLHLLAHVHLTGTMQGHPLELTATEAHLDRTADVADLLGVVARSDGRTGQADHAIAYFRPDGSMERVQATGSVELMSGTERVTATRLEATLNATSKPVAMRLSGGVAMADSNPLRPVHASAAAVDATFDGEGLPKTAIATGAVSAWMVDKSGKGPDLNREMQGDRVVGTFVAERGKKRSARLTELDATGNARVKGDSLEKTKTGTVVKTLNGAGDALKAMFGEGSNGQVEMQHVSGVGHTRLEQETPLGEMETSTGDTLEMVFGASGASGGKGGSLEAGKIISAVQTGHVDIHTRSLTKASGEGAKAQVAKVQETTAGGDRGVYNGVEETLTLTGAARFSNGVDSLTAATVVMDQRSGDALAKGKVVAAVGGDPGAAPGAVVSGEQPVTHVMSAEARLTRVGKTAEFRGTDAAPAKMWQGASQVQAAVLSFDGVKRTMSARPLAAGQAIHAVFVQQGKAAGAGPDTHGVASKVVRVASQRMDYADVPRTATFSGSVKMDGEMGTVESDRAVVTLTPAKSGGAAGASQSAAAASPLGGSIEKAVAYGNVRMAEPGRRGTGDQLTYTAADDRFVLTGTAGHEPHVVDDQQGDVTGPVLIFEGAGTGHGKAADSTIIVAGQPPGSTAKSGRVRTETDVKR